MYWMQYRCYEYILASFLEIKNSWWCLISRRKMYLYGKFRVAPTAVAHCPPDVHFASNFALTFTINTHRSRQFTIGWSIPPFVIYWHIVYFSYSTLLCIVFPLFIERILKFANHHPVSLLPSLPRRKALFTSSFSSPQPLLMVLHSNYHFFSLFKFFVFLLFFTNCTRIFFHLKGSWDSPATINTSYTYYKASPSKFTSHIFHDYSYTFFFRNKAIISWTGVISTKFMHSLKYTKWAAHTPKDYCTNTWNAHTHTHMCEHVLQMYIQMCRSENSIKRGTYAEYLLLHS